MNQDQLGRMLGTSRRGVQRLESKLWRSMTISQLEKLAEVFKVSNEELFCELQQYGDLDRKNKQEFHTSKKDPFFVTELVEGVKLTSYVRRPKAFFMGNFFLPPKKTLTYEEVAKANYIFYCVLKGEAIISISKREYSLKQGSSLTLDAEDVYELYNPHHIYEANLLLFTSPSFIH